MSNISINYIILNYVKIDKMCTSMLLHNIYMKYKYKSCNDSRKCY